MHYDISQTHEDIDAAFLFNAGDIFPRPSCVRPGAPPANRL